MIYPVVVGRSVHLHEAIVLLVLVMLSEFGFIWVILAPPVAAAARHAFPPGSTMAPARSSPVSGSRHTLQAGTSTFSASAPGHPMIPISWRAAQT